MTLLFALAAVLLFLVGLALSAFFSGAETGFYRISYVRLSIDAQAGDRIAKRLQWFVHNPGHFVATTLVGNNVANYLTTIAIGMGLAVLSHDRSQPLHWFWQIAATLLLAPVVFLFGELMPKSRYYRAPMRLLKGRLRTFEIFYRLFWVISLPLIGVTRILEKFGDPDRREMATVLGRHRLGQVISRGHQEGLLTDLQDQLAGGLLQTASGPITESMTPTGRVLGLSESATSAEIIEHAGRYALTDVALHRTDSSGEWFACVRVLDLVAGRDVDDSMVPMPEFNESTSKLEALLAFRGSSAALGLVRRGDEVLGTISRRGLVGQLLEPRAGRPFDDRATADIASDPVLSDDG